MQPVPIIEALALGGKLSTPPLNQHTRKSKPLLLEPEIHGNLAESLDRNNSVLLSLRPLLRDTDNAFSCRALCRDSRRNLTGLQLELGDKLQHILLLTGIKGFDERVLCLNVRVTHRHENFHSPITHIKRKCAMSDYNPTIFLDLASQPIHHNRN